jgi:hypothetical protein
MILLIRNTMISAFAMAAEGAGHSHGDGGELEHLWVPLGFFAILFIGGVVLNLKSKKK